MAYVENATIIADHEGAIRRVKVGVYRAQH